MKHTKILIHLQNGRITAVDSNNKNLEYVVIDYDNKEHGDGKNFIMPAEPPESIADDLYQLFTDAADPERIEIRDELKRIHF